MKQKLKKRKISFQTSIFIPPLKKKDSAGQFESKRKARPHQAGAGTCLDI